MAAALPDYCVRPSAVLEDQKINWRHGEVPDYSAAEENYRKGKTVTHEPGSLGDIVSNLVKNWEKELSYKLDLADFRTIDAATFTFSVNGAPDLSAEKVLELGSYNALIGDQDLYCSSKTNFEDSHEAFRKAMPGGFAWEVLEVYSGPPKVVFKWRHWGDFTGPLVCPMATGAKKTFQPTGKKVELFGMAVAHVDDKLRVTRIEIWNDPNQPMRSMAACPVAA